LNSDDEQTTENRAMRKPTNTEQYSKERHFDEHEDGQILTAQPVSASYTVSCVSNGYDDYRHTVEPALRHSESATDAQARRPRVDVTQNGTNSKSPDRKKVFPSNNRNAVPEIQNVYENQVDNKNNRSVNVSRVRFEECWEDSPGRKPDYKVREASGISIRDETPGYKRSEIQRVANGDTDNLESKENTDNSSSKIERPVKDKQGKVTLNALVQDKPTGTKTNGHKDAIVYAKDNCTSRKRDVPTSRLDNGNRLDSGHPQGRSEITRTEEVKPLGLRQLIKIHEIQIAEVAKSAASMKRPLSGKAHEGRLVKVKIVPEIETKQSHVKQNATKVTFAGNKTSSDSPLPRKLPSVESRSKVVEPVNEKEGLNVKNEASIVKARTTVKPKRHTVELRTKPPVQEDQKWKRHTAIGLVGFDHQGHEVPHGEWSPRGKDSKKSFTSPDSDAEVEYLRKQPVEPEKQFVDEKIEKCDVTGLKTSPVINERDEVWKIPDEEKPVLDDESEIPPERPPLPENFYSSAEEILMRPPPPVYTNDFENNNPKLDFKPRADYVPRVEFKPNVEYVPAVDSNPNSEYIPTIDNKQNIGYVPAAEIQKNIGYVPKEDFTPNTGFVPKVDFEPNLKYRKKSPFSEQLRPIPLSSSLPAIHVSTAIVQSNGEHILEQDNIQEKDHVLGKTRTTREMYEERLARINLIPLDVSERHLANQELAASLCSSLESFAWDKSCNIHNSNKTQNLDKLKTCMKQMKVLTKQKEDLEKNFERERRDWKRKYEEQQKVANAYQKLEDRYRRQVQELQEALKLCRCTDTETRKTLFLGHSW
jgi:hypothetical protein